MGKDWQNKSAAALGRGVEAGEICPVALAETFLDAAAGHALGNRIYARLTRDSALAQAASARARAKAGQRLGPLDGVPVSWKDLFDTAGIATEAGSAVLQGRTPDRDAEVVANATAAGMIGLGKTHMSEFAYSGLGLNPVTATPPCVNNPDAVPGGSSSGAAASVAFGLAPLAIGSDTGGSVRIPAAWNDLVGLKTTADRVSLRGVVPLALRFDTIGPLARTVEDAALALAALEGRRAPDLRGASLDGVRFLVLDNVAFDDIRAAPLGGFDTAIARLEAAGATVTRRAVAAVSEAMPLSAVIYTPECYGIWRDVIEPKADLMFPPILERFRSGMDHSATDYVAAWNRLDRLRAAYLADTAEYDAVVLPTAPNLPPDAGRLMSDHAYYGVENLLTLRNTRIGNLMGLCVLTLPTGVPSTGISLMCPPMAEARLLRLGAAAEAALR
ncbi:amidase [Roseicitreum antarcticum]|uniref:Aspartyl-tRNA(Asn)/glutamyl-tRNA(Gln) amidotransferase subunit A n=1 Tax=Roseicitreum antarcticum TaxID=564137 RepID=A0A1H2R8M3_9RHOB|nr:amidase family protein [Roseicitreum antarcticum]SDW15480.1 aspartyl-tRNA(Asn)/glutamyl-tRNA(Gln) amidotransferase subunit A [Roseicitreum antarcticum]